MSNYAKEVAELSGDPLSTEDRRRTRHSNDFIRQTIERRTWGYNLLRVLGVVAGLALTLVEILHSMK